MEKLQEFEKKSWDEITRGGNHPILTADIVNPARDCLQTIHKDDNNEFMPFVLPAPTKFDVYSN